jgi:hypothetical protein
MAASVVEIMDTTSFNVIRTTNCYESGSKGDTSRNIALGFIQPATEIHKIIHVTGRGGNGVVK